MRAFVADFLKFGARRSAIACGLVAIGSLLEGASLVLVIPLLDVVSGSDAQPSNLLATTALQVFQALGLQDRTGKIALILAVFGVAMIIRSALMSRRQLAIAGLELDYLTAKQVELIQALGSAPWNRVVRLRHARITHLLSHDVHRVGQAATGLLQSFVAVIMLTIQFAIALCLSPVLTLLAIGLLVVAGLIIAPLFRAARELGETYSGAQIDLLNDTSQFLGALKLAVSQNLQPRFVADFSRTLRQLANLEIGYVERQNTVRLRLTIIAVIVATGTAFVGFGVLNVPPASLLALLLVLSRMSAPASQLQTQALEMVRCMPAFGMLMDLRQELFGQSEPAAPDAPIPRGDIAFREVSYLYGDDQDATSGGLRGFDLTIPAGAFVGVAGRSGAGKTTFADLLVGLYPPQSGAIHLGGAATRLDLTAAWRDQLSYVSQDPFLQNNTVRENLLWAKPDASQAELDAALDHSGAGDLIARLPEGLDTLVGERGSLISGGERQRLAIARALLRRPRLLILDEATNAIDVAGERELLTRLNALRPALTIVMIAHRLESLSLCDQVVIVDGGRVVANGAFDDLKPLMSDPELRRALSDQDAAPSFIA